jgi:predicted TIM-barrel fold metal-dependent hydrolase
LAAKSELSTIVNRCTAMQVMGADRIIFSVDYPFSTNEQGRAFLDHTSLSPADKEKISHLNAERLLKLAQA